MSLVSLNANYYAKRNVTLWAVTASQAKSFPASRAASGAKVHDSIERVIEGWHESRPDLPVEPIAVTARLARLQAVLSPRLEGVSGRFGLRGADFAVIATLVRLGERVSQTRLAWELGLSAGSVSLRIDRLERLGFAQRHPDPDDGRGALVALTGHGRLVFEACAPEHLANADELLTGLTDRERKQLGTLLGKLLRSLEEPQDEDLQAPELGLLVDPAPVAMERQRAVGLRPLAGLLVRHVEPASPAAAGGVHVGDLLVTCDRKPLRSWEDLRLALSRSKGRQRAVTLEIVRGSESMRVRLGPTG